MSSRRVDRLLNLGGWPPPQSTTLAERRERARNAGRELVGKEREDAIERFLDWYHRRQEFVADFTGTPLEALTHRRTRVRLVDGHYSLVDVPPEQKLQRTGGPRARKRT